MRQLKGIIGLVTIMGMALTVSGCSQPKIGMKNGRLLPCPSSPNCVSSQGQDKTHKVAPLVYTGPEDAAHAALISVLRSMPRSRIVTDTGQYIHATFTSRIFRFVDDVEFYFDAATKTIQVRSASRVGYSDLGVNRKRVEKIRQLFEEKIRSGGA